MLAPTTSSSHRSRLRLIVIQALVFRCWRRSPRASTTSGGDGGGVQGKAASQSVRDIVVHPHAA